jgi:hypothetical protein
MLRTLAPVSTPDFLLSHKARLTSRLEEIEIWGETRTNWQSTQTGQGHPEIAFHRGNGTSGGERPRSRYASISESSLEHVRHLLSWCYENEALDSARAATENVRTASGHSPLLPVTAVVKVRQYDHRVALVEGELTYSLPQDSGVELALERVQESSIIFMEFVAEDAAATSEALAHHPAFIDLIRTPSEIEAATRIARPRGALWVARAIVDAGPKNEKVIREHWLKDAESEGDFEQRGYATKWLNYYLGSDWLARPLGSPPLETDRPATEPTASAPGAQEFATPEAERVSERKAATDCLEQLPQQWDGLVLAQYYYSAFELLQFKLAAILVLTTGQNIDHDVEDVREALDATVGEFLILQVEYDETEKHLPREQLTVLRRTLGDWNFERNVLGPTRRHIEACKDRLAELHERGTERAAKFTDFILLALVFFTIFDVTLSFAEYGRSLSSDPALSTFDQGSWWDAADWIATRSTVRVLLASLLVTAGLLLVWFGVRRRSRQL